MRNIQESIAAAGTAQELKEVHANFCRLHSETQAELRARIRAVEDGKAAIRRLNKEIEEMGDVQGINAAFNARLAELNGMGGLTVG